MVESPSRRGKPCNSLTGFLTFPSNFRLLYWQIYSKHKPNMLKDLSKPDIEAVKLQSIKIPVITWRNYHEETRHESSPHLTPRLWWICKAKPEKPPTPTGEPCLQIPQKSTTHPIFARGRGEVVWVSIDKWIIFEAEQWNRLNAFWNSFI